MPGPGYYEPKGSMEISGDQIISQYGSVKVRRFGTAQRPNISNSNPTPGPGTYRPPSDFGYLSLRSKGFINVGIKTNRAASTT
jgi:Sperm-tail PG-rich repeat